MVEVLAYWSNDDMESRILLRASLWRAIENGRSHERRAWSWYEGRRYRVLWRFENGFVSIDGEDGAQHVQDLPVGDLNVEAIPA